MTEACDALDIIRTKNRNNPEWINRGLYRLLYNPTLHIMAYERLKSKPGNMTPGTDGQTLDGYSIEEIYKYFLSEGTRNWTFYGKLEGEGGQPYLVRLLLASDIPIKRHVKIKGEANPYDPQWELYFEERLTFKMTKALKGQKQLLRLWEEQDGICPVCHQVITPLIGWHNHHIVWRTYGGSDRTENRVLLHPNYHNQIHSSGKTVEKPRSERSV